MSLQLVEQLPSPSPVTTAPLAQPTPPGGQGRQHRATAVTLVAVLLAGVWLLGGFWTSVQLRSPRAPYPSALAGQGWARSPEPGARAFFRLSFPVTTMPLTATLWVDADQAVTPYLNGFRVGAPPELPPYAAQANLAPAATGQAVPEQVDTLDLLPALDRGMNTMGLEVVNLADRAPSFQARIELNFGAGTVVMGTRPGDWLSTTNVALTAQAFPESGTFSEPDVSTAGWVLATSAPAWSDRRLVEVPADAFTTPTDGHVLASGAASGLLTASTVVRVPPGCGHAWIRVAATGPYDLSINGQVIAQGPGGHGTFGSPDGLGRAVGELQKPYTLAAYQVCGLLPIGAVRVAVSVDAGVGTQAMLYVDGLISTPRSKTTFATGPAWTSPSGANLAVLDHPQTAFDADLQILPAQVAFPTDRYIALRLGDSGWALLVAAVALGLALVLGAPRRRAVASVVLGVLPAASLVVVLDETKHLNFVFPPFPATPSSLLAVSVVFIAGEALAVVLAVRAPRQHAVQGRGHRGHRDRPAPATSDRQNPGPVTPGTALSETAGPVRRTVRYLAAHLPGVGIVATCGAMVAMLSYQLNWDYLWQDELDSIIAADGIRRHILPIWPSGFEYWKSELYSASIAVIGALTNSDIASYRMFSVVLFGATVLLFGFVLAPMAMPGRRGLQFITTFLFAVAPIEGQFARDVRMYQMVQFFVVLVAILLARALARPTTRRVALAMATVVCMYLAHEVSFAVLPIIPLALFARFGWAWARNWRWWVFGGLAAGVICVQVLLAIVTHPPAYGVDPSGGPLIAWSPNPFFYIDNVFLTPGTAGGTTMISWLAVAAAVTALWRRDHLRRYLVAFWAVPATLLSLVFPSDYTRYVFICLPFVFVLAGCALGDISDWAGDALRRLKLGEASRTRTALCTTASALVLVAVAISLFNGPSDVGPISMKFLRSNVAHSQYDYGTADAYVRSHWQQGDAVIAAGRPNWVEQGIGEKLTYWMTYHQSYVLLYVFEKKAQLVDTQFGVPVILNDEQLVRDIDVHPRIWLITSDDNISSFPPAERATLASRFKLVENGESTCVFLATNYPAGPALPVGQKRR